MIRVLVVEDDRDMRLAIRDVLVMKGLAVETASGGTGAIGLLEHEEYDVVVTDLRLPGASGLLVTRVALDRLHPPSVVIITAYPEWYTNALESGATRIIRKPLNLERLAETVIEEAGRP
jgi:CheY-like chemotaxis protein